MAFPSTRLSLIQRIALTGTEADWQQFLADYWGPVCRFAWRYGHCPWQDAEDVAGQTFLAIFQQGLLARWVAAPSAKLRTLLCAVVRNVLANRARVATGRARLLREHGDQIAQHAASPAAAEATPAESLDVFYAAWAEELIGRSVDALLGDYHRAGKGDHFRVLYGKLCEDMPLTEVAAALGLTVSQAENAYKDARKRLAQQLEVQVRAHVRHYCEEGAEEAEFAVEWADLAHHLRACGGLEGAVRRTFEHGASSDRTGSPSLRATLEQVVRSVRQR